MRKKLTRGQKAAATRKANAALKNIKEPWKVSENQVGPAEQPIYSLSKALDNSLDRLERRMAGYIARVDRILA